MTVSVERVIAVTYGKGLADPRAVALPTVDIDGGR